MRYIIFFLFINFSLIGQNRINIPLQLYKELNKNLNLDEYIGSVYLFDNFKRAKFILSDGFEEIFVNYNVYTNKFNFKQIDGSEYEINFKEGVKIEVENQVFDFFKYKEQELIGVQLSKINNNILYKIYRTVITPPKNSSYGYDLPKPGKIEVEPYYYFFYNNKLIITNEGRKNVIDKFYEYKSLIKSKKFKFKNDDDFISFFNLIQ